jgi:prevent-host-death family protein
MKKIIAAGAFKAQCLRIIDEVAGSRAEVVITKHGKPKARLIPFDENPPALFGFMHGTVVLRGDITAPLDEPWEASEDTAET